MKCDVCGAQGDFGVYSSSLGPVSFCYCPRCGERGYEPYNALVCSLADDDFYFDPEILSEELDVLGVSKFQFWEDIVKEREKERESYVQGGEIF